MKKKATNEENIVVSIEPKIEENNETEVFTENKEANLHTDSSTPANISSLPKQKGLSKSNYAMLVTHTIKCITSIFISTFLVSYIYSISENYVFNIGMFYLMTYVVMGIAYFLISWVIDRTNRVLFYQLSIIIYSIFILCVVLFGKDLASYVALAGALFGFAEACYWTSFNLMKNELVPSRLMKNYSTIQLSADKFVNIVFPIFLGKLIDVDSFKTSALIVLGILVVQIISSFFIKSKRPENSSFNLKEFFLDIKNLGEKGKLIKLLLSASLVYGAITIIAPLNTILIMYSFQSNFSLGLLTSIFSIFAMLLLIFLNKGTRPGKRLWIYIVAIILPAAATIVSVVWTNQITIIIFSLLFTVLAVVHTYFFDVFRNVIIKKFNLYQDIAEFQFCIESLLCVARVITFGIMVICGLIGAGYGNAGLLLTTKILLGVLIFAIPIVNIMLIVIEKKLIKYEII